MFIGCHQIIIKMNEAGRSKTPFLFAVNFEMNEGFFIENPLKQSRILFNINGITNAKNVPETPKSYIFKRYPESFETYEKRFYCAMDALHKEETFLLNLTIKTPIETSLSLQEIFNYSSAKYRLYVPEKFVCFSPEQFVIIKYGKIFMHPMKGTIDATLPNAAERLLSDYKETAEHQTITELTLNDLKQVATSVKVTRSRYIDKLKTNNGYMLQTSSEIEGTLPTNYMQNLGILFFKLLPAGSILGTPRNATLRVIRNCENQNRGFYSGVAGYFDGENLDSGVLIRFIEKKNGKMYFRSGGGITVDSQCESEYNEAVQKVYLPF